MPTIKLWCLPPKLSERKLRELHQLVVKTVVDIKPLGLKDETEMMTLFPADMMKYGAGSEILIEVSELLDKPERTPAVRQELARNLGEAVKCMFPDAKVVCRLDPPFNRERGYWVSK